MKFCPNCDNILFPRKKKVYCNACNEEFNLDLDNKDEYKMKLTIKHDEIESTLVVVKEGLKKNKLTVDDRKAHEDFFANNEIS